jgi:branched-subunit amino acid transport protein AzlD
MVDNSYILSAIATIAVVNYFTRVLPFLFFNKSEPPNALIFLEKIFPPVIMTILIFYSLKGVDLTTKPYGAYEFSAVVLTFILHMVFKNYLLSIIAPTIFYMALTQGLIN